MNIDWLLSLFEPFQRTWEAIRSLFGPYKEFVDYLTLASTSLISVSYLLARLFKGWSFLARYHYDGGVFGYVRVLRKFGLTIRVDPLGFRSADTARLLTEYEILKPAPARPHRSYPVKDRGLWARFKQAIKIRYERWKRLSGWRQEMKVWRKKRDQALRNLIDLKSRSRAERDQMEDKVLREEKPIIYLDNPARIDRCRENIARYFEIGRRYAAYEFVSYVQFDYGYVAPLFLITGLMTRFEQQWKPIIDNYRKQLQHSDSTSQGLLELQSFEFNCWLLWGPSIPLCDCSRMQAMSKRHDAINAIFYQYGFGDENNSVDVRILDGRSKSYRDWLLRQGASSGNRQCTLGTEVNAIPVMLTGKIRHKLAIHEISTAQKIICDPEHGRVFLCEVEIDHPLSENCPSNYYSAYLWVMFVLVGNDGAPLHATPMWKNLLPFFEHGNIADASTMQSLKASLVAKSCSALKEILARPSDGTIKIQYACAFDDSNCGHEILFPPKRSILDLLKSAVEEDTTLSLAVSERRLILRTDIASNAFSSCKLPDIVTEFYLAIETDQKAQEDLDWERDWKQSRPWYSRRCSKVQVNLST